MTCNESVNTLTTFVSRGITPKYTVDTEGSIVVLNQKCIRDFKIRFEPTRRSNLALRKVPDEKLLKKYDVVINSTGVGTLGRVAQYMGDLVQTTVDSHVTIVRPRCEVIDPLYFGYLIKAKQAIIESLADGSTGQTELSRDVLKELTIDFVEDRDKQKKIGLMLQALDNKIELNHQINQTLEAMAQAIFKSWFVNFEPVKAKIAAIEAGKDTKGITCTAMRTISGKTDDELDQLQVEQPENYAQLKTTAELFPSAMQDSELGEIPLGWKWKRADEMCDISIGRTPPRKESQWFSSFPDGLKWISIRDMGEYGVFAIDTSETLTHEAVKKFNVKKVPDKTLILSFKLTVGRVAITSGEMLTNEAIAHFIQKPEINIPTSFYYLYLKQFDYNLLGSTSSIATAVNSKTIKALPIIKPVEDLVGRFDILIEPLFSQIKLVEEQNRELSQLREILLPKLLLGELSVDAVEFVEAEA